MLWSLLDQNLKRLEDNVGEPGAHINIVDQPLDVIKDNHRKVRFISVFENLLYLLDFVMVKCSYVILWRNELDKRKITFKGELCGKCCLTTSWISFKKNSEKLSTSVLLVLDLVNESLTFCIILRELISIVKEPLLKFVFKVRIVHTKSRFYFVKSFDEVSHVGLPWLECILFLLYLRLNLTYFFRLILDHLDSRSCWWWTSP